MNLTTPYPDTEENRKTNVLLFQSTDSDSYLIGQVYRRSGRHLVVRCWNSTSCLRFDADTGFSTPRFNQVYKLIFVGKVEHFRDPTKKNWVLHYDDAIAKALLLLQNQQHGKNNMTQEEHDRNSGVSAEMPRYRCHKEVWALKIKNIEALPNGYLITPEEPGYEAIFVPESYVKKHTPYVGGYYVVYDGGYQSFSPAQAFNEGYTRINP